MAGLVPLEPEAVAQQPSLRWQSQMILLLVLPAAAVWLAILLLRVLGATGPGATDPGANGAGAAGSGLSAIAGLSAGAVLALGVWRARAATPAGALTGGLLMGCFCLTTPGWHSSAWALITMLALTLGATRVGRAGKRPLSTAETTREMKHGRSAAQVAANLGMAALAGTLIDAQGQLVALTVLLAALAEAGADTLASELGQVRGGVPRLITTLRSVPPGTDGGVTVTGTVLGALGAIVIAAVGVFAMALPWPVASIAAGAGVCGLLFDSLLGATLERAGRLNNDAVNFLSTVFAAMVALGVEKALR